MIVSAGIRQSQISMTGVACPSSSQCTAIDSAGKEVTFNPSSPADWSVYAVDPGHTLEAVACPTTSQCTAVDDRGREVTFDPQSPETVTLGKVDHNQTAKQVKNHADALAAVSCLTSSQCVAIDGWGRVVVFSPSDPAGATVHRIATSLSGISCASLILCVAIDSSGFLTFNPSTPSTTHLAPASNLTGPVACASAVECVAFNTSGASVAVRPGSPSAAPPGNRNLTGTLVSFSCTSSNQCTAMDTSGQETTFNPTMSSTLTQRVVDTAGDWPKGTNAGEIACPSLTLCTVVSETFGGHEMTFDPQATSGVQRSPIDDGAPNIAVSCPLARECVALGKGWGNYVPTPVISSARFNPATTGHPTGLELSGVADPSGLACVSGRQCTLVTGRIWRATKHSWTAGGKELTYNPRTGKERYAGTHKLDTTGLTGISCPAARRCTAIDRHGHAIAFNPRHPHQAQTFTITTSHLTSIACVSTSECVTVDRAGREIEFNPLTQASRTPVRLDKHALISVSCPTDYQCTAITHGRTEVTFNPLTGARRKHHRIDISRLSAISCPTRGFCVAVDDNGRTTQGNPRRRHQWTITGLPEAGRLLAVSCNSGKLCVATDTAGHAYTIRT